MFRNDAKQSLKLKGEKYLEIIDVQIVLQVMKAEAMTLGCFTFYLAFASLSRTNYELFESIIPLFIFFILSAKSN